jgi:hypothetical protein
MCLDCGLGTYSGATSATTCNICDIKFRLKQAVTEGGSDVVYWRDCRAACSGVSQGASAASDGFFEDSCCDNVEVSSVAIPADGSPQSRQLPIEDVAAMLNAAVAATPGAPSQLFTVTADSSG